MTQIIKAPQTLKLTKKKVEPKKEEQKKENDPANPWDNIVIKKNP